MSIIFDPADRGASQNAAQGNVAQGSAAQNGAVQNGAAQEIPASVRNAMELNPNAAQSAGEQGGEQTPSAPTWRYEVNTPRRVPEVRSALQPGRRDFCALRAALALLPADARGVQKLVDSAAGSMICAAVDVTKLPELPRHSA